MAKHRYEAPKSGMSAHKGAVILGGIAAAAVVAPVAPALAAPVTIPGVGTFDTPLQDKQIPDFLKPQEKATKKTKKSPSQSPKASKKKSASLPKLFGDNTNTTGEKVVEAAKSRLGAPYVWGGTGPWAFDCSGLVQWSYKQAGKSIPRDAYSQLAGGTPVSKDNLQPGDVLIYDGGGHSAIYVGNGQIIHASTEGQPVKYAPAFQMNFTAARRY